MSSEVICIAGKNSIAVSGLHYVIENYCNSHRIIAVANCNDSGVDTWQPSLLKHSRSRGVEVVQIEDLYSIANLVFISLEFDRIIDPTKFTSNQLFNIHFSLLPKYKGMYTSAHPILNNEKESGCTIHSIDKGIDTGEIISQCTFDILDTDTAKDLYKKYLCYGTSLTINTIDSLVDGTYKTLPQSSQLSSYYSKRSINYNVLELNTNATAFQIKKQLQAYTFRDYQLPTFAGSKIFGCSIANYRSSNKAGRIVNEDEKSITISTIDYDLIMLKDKFEDLLKAILSNDAEMVTKIAQDNLKTVNETNSQGWTPLIISAFNGINECTEVLLRLGADPNATNSKGTTPLMYAKDYAEKTGDTFGISKLMEFGADIRKKDIFGKSICEYLNINSKYNDAIMQLLLN